MKGMDLKKKATGNGGQASGSSSSGSRRLIRKMKKASRVKSAAPGAPPNRPSSRRRRDPNAQNDPRFKKAMSRKRDMLQGQLAQNQGGNLQSLYSQNKPPQGGLPTTKPPFDLPWFGGQKTMPDSGGILSGKNPLPGGNTGEIPPPGTPFGAFGGGGGPGWQWPLMTPPQFDINALMPLIAQGIKSGGLPRLPMNPL